ncbi:phytanoyl-CoA dioxygenase family protein [Sphingobium phenoxybenzoativorans]|uniref:phytanoyl-CoA dioxygenase family protein n=1 Tax=Sphingobium phenoxybenzoativorans TaxID=1592790 RepID=UPI000A70F67C|nr:phytanoyl-CoA dioxygenase family protein [Sphingobium phenoxybenzoativorans]
MSDLATAFARDGAVLVQGALTSAEVERLAAGIDANLATPSPRALIASKPDDPGQFVEDFRCWQDNAAYREIIFTSRLGEIAAGLMGSRTARLHHDHMLTKLAGTRQATPWHQDQPYYNIAGRQNVSFWIPVDPVPRQASLEFVAGSHLGPWLMPRSFMDKQAKWFPEGTLAELPDIDAEPSAYDVLGWAVRPGDAIAFHMLTLHRAPGSAALRRVFSARFIGDDARHAVRDWATSPDFPDLSETLPDGAPFDGPLFPLIWPEIDK